MKLRIPLQDVPVIDLTTGLMVPDWYDAFKRAESLGLLDMADVPTAAPANGQKPTWNSATSKWTWV